MYTLQKHTSCTMFAATVHWARSAVVWESWWWWLLLSPRCPAGVWSILAWCGAAEAIENGGEHGETTKKPSVLYVLWRFISFICICCLRVTKQQYSTIHDFWPQAFWISPGTLKFLPKHWEHWMDQTWWGSTPICQQFQGKLLCK